MFSIVAFLENTNNSTVLLNAEDWKEAQEKAKEMRDRGYHVEVWHKDGSKLAYFEARSPLPPEDYPLAF